MMKRVISLILFTALLFCTIPVTAKTNPSAAPTPSASSVPSPEPSITPTPLPSPESIETPAASEAPWFDGCALIGDSISDGLKLYAVQKRKKDPGFLGNLQFLTCIAYSLSYASSSSPKKMVEYDGRAMKPEDALCEMGARKVFIMLGINDIFHDWSENNLKYRTLIENIRAKNPNIKIALIAITPIVTEGQYSAFQNTKVNDYNTEVVKNTCMNYHC